ncbi:hypothetical protein CTI14_46195, partial [Methylobacterium radiotolerans]
MTGYPGYNMMSLVYDTLFLNDIGDVPRSWLVDSYSVKDGKVWTLKLKDGVKCMKASSVVRLVSAVLALSASTTVLASHTGKRIV